MEFAEGSAPRTTLSFRTSAHAGVGISIEFRVAHRHTDCPFCAVFEIYRREVVLLTGGLPRQCAHWLAMTGNSIARQIPICRATDKNRYSHSFNRREAAPHLISYISYLISHNFSRPATIHKMYYIFRFRYAIMGKIWPFRGGAEGKNPLAAENGPGKRLRIKDDSLPWD